MSIARIAPRQRAEIGIEGLLQWAFQIERAVIHEPEEHRRPGRSTVATIIERGDLGCTIDFCGSAWERHDDADEVIAAVERLAKPVAHLIADVARSGLRPIGLSCATQRWEPSLGWTGEMTGGRTGVTAVVDVVKVRKRAAKGWTWATREVRFTPVRLTPSSYQVNAARLVYGRWWGGLNEIRGARALRNLRDWQLTEAMPPQEPWETGR